MKWVRAHTMVMQVDVATHTYSIPSTVVDAMAATAGRSLSQESGDVVEVSRIVGVASPPDGVGSAGSSSNGPSGTNHGRP